MRLAAVALLLAAAALLGACGERSDPARPDVPPITGAAIDAIRGSLREVLEREFEGAHAERVRIERTEDGRRAVVHASLAEELDEATYTRLCEAIAAAAGPVLVEGQSLEVHLLSGDAVLHSCGL